MIEVSLQMYVYALYMMITFSVGAFILVIRSLKSSVLPITSIKLYNLYFIIGVSGWIGLGIKDAAHIQIDLTISVIFYIICSFILMLAVAECSRKKRPTLIVGLLHAIIIISSLFLKDDISRVIFISIYSLILYPFISYISIKRAWKNKNIGNGIIGFSTLIVVCCTPFQLNSVLIADDASLAYGIILIASSTGFMLVGIGFLTSILINEHRQLKLLTLKDPLTGLLNRRGMEFAVNVSLNSAQRSNKCISAIAIDIDYFKNINDTYGHDGGDRVLQELGNILLDYTRKHDVCCRLGGEEFIIVQPETNSDIAVKVAERIRQRLEKLEILHENGTITLTSSFGVASHTGEVNLDSLLKDADKALYTAKSSGRNCVIQAPAA